MSTARVLQLVPVLDQIWNRIESEAIGPHIGEPVPRDVLHLVQYRGRLIVEIRHLVPENPVVVLVTHW